MADDGFGYRPHALGEFFHGIPRGAPLREVFETVSQRVVRAGWPLEVWRLTLLDWIRRALVELRAHPSEKGREHVVHDLVLRTAGPFLYHLIRYDEAQASVTVLYTDLQRCGLPEFELNAAKALGATLTEINALGSVYSISAGLAAQLEETELRGLRGADLRLPFGSVLFQYSTPLLRINPGEAIFDGLRSVFATEWHDSHQEHRQLWMCYETEATVKGTPVFSYHTQRFDLEDALTLDEIVDRTSPIREPAELEARRRIFRYVLNTILYATWPDAEVEHVIANEQARKLWTKIQQTPPSKKRDRMQLMLDGMDVEKVRMLGRSVVPICRQQVEHEDADGESVKTGRKLVVQKIVPGYWRQQPYGPQHSLRRRQWINPYVRGPEGAPLAQAVHHLVARKDLGGAS